LGKTSLALNIVRNAALDHGARVALFSLEMSKMELAYRFLSSESGVDTQRIRLDQLSEGQRDSIMEAMGLLSETPIYIDDSPYLRDSDMRSKAKRLHSEKGIDLIIIAKHRNGPTGRISLYFRERMAKFENMERQKNKPSLL